MKVKVVSRKLVKPYKPTPPHLRTYKISLLDVINPDINHVRLLYFSSNGGISKAKSVCLEESMAQILSNYYPLAGRYDKEKRQVDCNDQGAHFSTSEADGDLSQIITVAGVEPEKLNHFLPVDVTAVDDPNDPLLAVQINRFECGGLAIAACGSNRVMDAAAFSRFMTDWAKAAASDGSLLNQPYFDPHSYFPTENLPSFDYHEEAHTEEKIVVRRFVFDSEAIEKLRRQLSASAQWNSERPPSRVIVVSTFLTQALLRADMLRHGKARAAVIGNLINIRERTVPPIPNHAFGTWLAVSFLELTAAEAAAHAARQQFAVLAAKTYNTTAQAIRDCSRALSDKVLGRKLVLDSFFEASEKAVSAYWKVIWVTDISKFGEYNADFGFGKPEWVSIAPMPLKDHIVLLNNRSNDGIEAYVFLEESDMQVFPSSNFFPDSKL